VRLLLDTHIWLWSVGAPERLTRRAARALGSAANELWLSPISLWELTLLAAKGRIRLDKGVDEWVADAMRRVPVTEAPLTYDVALETSRIGLHPRDPADAFLTATARVFGLTLVTADEKLIAAGLVPTLANR